MLSLERRFQICVLDCTVSPELQNLFQQQHPQMYLRLYSLVAKLCLSLHKGRVPKMSSITKRRRRSTFFISGNVRNINCFHYSVRGPWLSRKFAWRIVNSKWSFEISPFLWNRGKRWFKYDRDWFVCKQAALRSSCATLREWSHNLHPPSCSS